jgi:hypothetical protein
MRFLNNHEEPAQPVRTAESAARTADMAVQIGKSLLNKLDVTPEAATAEMDSPETVEARERWNAENPYDRLLDRDDKSVAEGQLPSDITDNELIQEQLDAEAADNEKPGTL